MIIIFQTYSQLFDFDVFCIVLPCISLSGWLAARHSRLLNLYFGLICHQLYGIGPAGGDRYICPMKCRITQPSGLFIRSLLLHCRLHMDVKDFKLYRRMACNCLSWLMLLDIAGHCWTCCDLCHTHHKTLTWGCAGQGWPRDNSVDNNFVRMYIIWLMFSTPLKNISQLGWLSHIYPYIMENKTCLKPPTSHTVIIHDHTAHAMCNPVSVDAFMLETTCVCVTLRLCIWRVPTIPMAISQGPVFF